MTTLRRLPAALALLLLGALALRLGLPFPLAIAVTLALVVVLFLPRVDPTPLVVLLGLGSLGWVTVACQRVAERWAAGQPWLRLALILGAVACFTAGAGWLLRPRRRD